MTGQILKIKYKCLHQDCQIKSCREGVLDIEESIFNQLSSSSEDKTLFKSPRGLCRMGFPQTLKIINMNKSEGAGAEQAEDKRDKEVIEKKIADPIEILKEEHKVMLNKLDLIDKQLHYRDIDGLWITTAEVENEVLLHSIEKEESILFPLLKKVSALTVGPIAVMKEDHRELLALLHSFRDGLREGDITDGIAYSILSNLRSHIAKEDNEFFEMVNGYLDAEGRVRLLEGMAKADESHIVMEAGERRKEPSGENDTDIAEREVFNEALLAARKSAKDEGACH